MRYKVGDKVTIRRDLKIGEDYGGYMSVSPMERYAGKEAEIIEIRFFGYYPEGVYFIDIDNGSCVWTDEMLEDKNPFTLEDLQNGMKVITRNGLTGWVLDTVAYNKDVKPITFIEHLQNNMKHKARENLDIMEVYHGDELVYKREESENQEILDKISELEKQLAELKEMV